MAPRTKGRLLASVLFVDMVGSTRIAAEVGDATWRELLRRYRDIVRLELRGFGGREVDSAGDGFFAIFRQPEQALRCAAAIADEVRVLGIEVRAGLHAGQCEISRHTVEGVTVHTGARVMSLAGPGEILATRTIRDLSAGARFGWEERGAHRLEGIVGLWDIEALTTIDGNPRSSPTSSEVAGERRKTIHAPSRLRARRPQIVIGGIIALALTAGIVLMGGPATRDSQPRASAPPPPGSVVALSHDTGKNVAVIRNAVPATAGGQCCSGRIAIASDRVWALAASSLAVLDPATESVAGVLPVWAGGAFHSGDEIAFAFRTIWITAQPGLMRVDPLSMQEQAPITLPGGPPRYLVAGPRWIWVAYSSGPLLRIDPDSLDVSSEIHVGFPIGGLAYGEGALWVVDDVRGRLLRVVPDRDRVVDRFRVQADIDAVVVGEGQIWVLDRRAGIVFPIDPDERSMGRGVRVGSTPTGITMGLGSVWVPDANGTVFRIEAATHTVTRHATGAPLSGIAVDEAKGRIWLVVSEVP